MTAVNSVLGPIDSSKLGVTLAHEHILSSNAGIPQNFPEFLEDNYMDHIVEGLNKAKAAGIQTVVDCRPGTRCESSGGSFTTYGG